MEFNYCPKCGKPLIRKKISNRFICSDSLCRTAMQYGRIEKADIDEYSDLDDYDVEYSDRGKKKSFILLKQDLSGPMLSMNSNSTSEKEGAN